MKLKILAILGIVMMVIVPMAQACETTVIYAKALGDHGCDSTEWHFVITGIAGISAPNSINVSWANGANEVVPLDKVTGNVAHYATTSNLNSTVTQAAAEIAVEWSGQFNLSHGPCVPPPPPPMCEWDENLPADDPLCVPPVMCEWDENLPADDPLCVPPTPPVVPPPSYKEGPAYCFASINPTNVVVNEVPAKWEYDGYGRAVFHSGSVTIGQNFWLSGVEWTSGWVNGEPLCWPLVTPVVAQGESPVTGGQVPMWYLEAWH